MTALGQAIDGLDARLLEVLTTFPRAGTLEWARRLGVARGTVQARTDRLERRGVIRGFGPSVDVEALGYDVLAFTTLEVAQGRLNHVVEHLRDIPEVLEAHGTSGEGDLHCRVAARNNRDLQRVINRMLEVRGINRTTTVIALSEQIGYRVLPLVTSTRMPQTEPGEALNGE
ncbi:MAG TPA: Lrp/AsnC family transcriptional regulator [Acidimicrobiales bacterium]|jgi:DNA-binding Lrp family transcriptional regulator|nr:Lrp/AsnC family transcriptional regulator [Acidimicrobiales bacterium]